MVSTAISESNLDANLSNDGFHMSLDDRSRSDYGKTQHQYRLNRLELEHAYYAEQNAHLVKELSFARCTINALRNITNQKESLLITTRQELDRAYFHIQMLNMTLARQEQRLQEQQKQQQKQNLILPEADKPLMTTLPENDAPYASTGADSPIRIGPYLQQRWWQKQQQQQQQQQLLLQQKEQVQSGSAAYHNDPQQLTPPESPRSVSDEMQQPYHIGSDDDEEQVRDDSTQCV
ncbi:hypothetical protein BX666DRAFT_1955796 [Dichotomocladium elegans]|nr:hypothetical protein BX666DRAFT_1955796 [Dichotomocladium elegans]